MSQTAVISLKQRVPGCNGRQIMLSVQHDFYNYSPQYSSFFLAGGVNMEFSFLGPT